MTVRHVALGVAIGSPLFALYILGVLLAFDMDSAPGQYALVIPVSYFLGSMPWGFLLTQVATGGQPAPSGTALPQKWEQEPCHPERSEGSKAGERFFAALRMTFEAKPHRGEGACSLPFDGGELEWG